MRKYLFCYRSRPQQTSIQQKKSVLFVKIAEQELNWLENFEEHIKGGVRQKKGDVDSAEKREMTIGVAGGGKDFIRRKKCCIHFGVKCAL